MRFNTIYEILRHSVEKFPKKVASAMFGGEEVTFSDVWARVEDVQAQLMSAGLNPGDKVVLLSGSMPNWGVCYFAATTAGMVVVPILPDFTGEELDKLIAHCEAKALCVSDRLFSKLSKQTIESLNIVIRTKNLSIISQKVHAEGSKMLPKPEDLAAIIYTSGTTSQPKGVMLTHYNIASNVSMCYDLFPIDENDSMLSVLPMAHTYECTLGFLYIFSAGGTVTYLEKQPTASVLLPALKKVRPTCFLIVPLIIEKVYRAQILAKFTSNGFWRWLYSIGFIRRYLHRVAGKKLQKAFGGKIRFLGIGGAKLDTQVEQFLLDAKFPYAIGYGLTETAPLVAGQIPGKCKLGATGPAMKGVEVRLDDINPETQQGEIVVNSPSAMAGYYKNEEATATAFTRDGWYRTGDLGYIDEDGYIFIKGRLKNMILGPSGENIYPEEIESVINSNAYVSESLVTEQDGQLVALVHFDTDAIERLKDELMEKWEISRDEWHKKKDKWAHRMEELKKEIVAYVNSKVNRFSRISKIEEEEKEFEKTPTKKIRRFLYSGKKSNQETAKK
ncbi:MAG: AMP-binding protein [Alistipes sp.]|nr:AMP-binding protein [Alistipes sp.]